MTTRLIAVCLCRSLSLFLSSRRVSRRVSFRTISFFSPSQLYLSIYQSPPSKIISIILVISPVSTIYPSRCACSSHLSFLSFAPRVRLLSAPLHGHNITVGDLARLDREHLERDALDDVLRVRVAEDLGDFGAGRMSETRVQFRASLCRLGTQTMGEREKGGGRGSKGGGVRLTSSFPSPSPSRSSLDWPAPSLPRRPPTLVTPDRPHPHSVPMLPFWPLPVWGEVPATRAVSG